MERNLIYRHVLSIELNDCTLDELLQKLNECKELYPDQELKISYDGEPYNGPSETTVYYHSLESDEEFKSRIEFEHDNKEAKERKEMARLLGCEKLNAANQKKLNDYLRKYLNG